MILMHDNEKQLQDIIVEMDHIGGFEWPRVLVITRKSVFHQFEEKNCIMRDLLKELKTSQIKMTTLYSMGINLSQTPLFFKEW